MNQAAVDTGDEQGVVDLQLNGVLEPLIALPKHRVEALSLGHGARKAVEDEATRGRRSASTNTDRGRGLGRPDTHPPRHSLLLSSSSLIMPITMSSLTRPP